MRLLEHGLTASGACRTRRRCGQRQPTGTIFSMPTSAISATCIDMDAIRGAKSASASIRWAAPACTTGRAIAERYRLDLTVVSEEVDPTFRFMTLDWDGRIRMDPSSPYAMQRLIGLKDRFDIAFACDTDHDRHGIVTRRRACCRRTIIWRSPSTICSQHRPQWGANAAVGKTVVSTQHDRLAWPRELGRTLYECRSASSGSSTDCSTARWASAARRAPARSFLRRDGTVWTTDKDGIVPALLSAEITARSGPRPRRRCTRAGGRVRRAGRRPRRGAGARRAKEAAGGALAAADRGTELAGEKIASILSHAPGNGAPIGGIKVMTAERLVRRASVGHRRHLQDLCRELPRRGASAAHPDRSAGHRRPGDRVWRHPRRRPARFACRGQRQCRDTNRRKP